MSDQNQQSPDPTHQDPAEPNQLDTEVETNDQSEPDAVEVSPEEPAGDVRTVHGQDYTVTPDAGYRRS